jgi:hypothetical protein
MTDSIKDLINNIDNGSLADAEQIFNDIMDIKAGEALDAYRQQVASNMFGGEEIDDQADDSDDDFVEDDFSGDEDEDV